ncbi:MAG TPA: glycoside hydrolase family 3 C-terminal domain-containing protein [Polyangiaceae bacterium]|nr:glycoside hydrolase family 3 C-terminal domain-containing protein [Polyangiaceae bacterium]
MCVRLRATYAVSLIALVAACDPGRDHVPEPLHQAWQRRACPSNAPTFVAGGATGEPELDLCAIDSGALQANGELPEVAPARARALALMRGLSQSEKLTLVQGWSGAYVGNGKAVSGVPALTLQDGPAGVARFSDVTAFPAPIAFAASWDRDLAQSFGEAMGAEQRGKGVMIQLGPMMNLARVPAAGRNFEGFGEDPYLAAELAARDVLGIQSQKVVATAKHYVGNEQETNRVGGDSQIDERTLEELYDAPFSASVEAGVGAVMCSYNRVNGVYACEDSDTLGALKNGLGFAGFVMSDWGATHSTAASANAGLDLEMPLGANFGQLGSAIDGGAVPQARLDDMVTRILTSLVRVGVLDDPPSGTPASVVTSSAHADLARRAATESIVLLKNDSQLLPLDTAQSVLVIGEAGNTNPSAVGAGSAFVNPPYVVSPLSAIQARAGVDVRYDDGTTDSVTAAAATADVALIFVTVPSGEGADRASLSCGLDSLISTIAAINPNTIVVLNSPGAVLMPWLAQVRGVLVAWYPGQENGNAIASVLYGDENPSGKLPVTFPARENDLPTPNPSPTVPYDEKLKIGYRALDAAGTAPLFAFGHGLSYTTFAYSDLKLDAGSSPGSLSVSFALTNTGSRAGTEVAELYLSFPVDAGEPPQVLRGFERLTLAPGATQTGAIELGPRALSCWSAASHARYVPSGRFGVTIGGSSRTPALTASFDVLGTGG